MNTSEFGQVRSYQCSSKNRYQSQLSFLKQKHWLIFKARSTSRRSASLIFQDLKTHFEMEITFQIKRMSGRLLMTSGHRKWEIWKTVTQNLCDTSKPLPNCLQDLLISEEAYGNCPFCCIMTFMKNLTSTSNIFSD